jgi:hypothetical protein
MNSHHKRKINIAYGCGLKRASVFLLIGSLQFLLFTELPIFSTAAQPALNSRNPNPTVQPKKVNPSTPSSPKQKSILESLLSLLQRKPFLGGSRSGGSFCGITPAVLGESNAIWSDRPLFLWQGKVQKLELRPYSFDVAYKNQSTLWSAVSTDQQASYPNEPLQAGQRYEWQVTYLSTQMNGPVQWQRTFQVMDKPGRDQIEQDLIALDIPLKTQNATVEDTALARAHYFANRDLWSDAIQQVYSVGHPFSAGNEFLQAATNRACHTNRSNLINSVEKTDRTN